ncbi:nuclear transport factor 2 family protein [Chloroflexota bacterium]
MSASVTANQRNQETFNRFMESLLTQDKAAMQACFKASANWHLPKSCHGKPHQDATSAEGIVAILTSPPDKIYQPETIEITPEVLVVGEQSAAFQFRNTCMAANGKSYDNRYVMVFNFEDGLISEVWEHLDTLYLDQVVDLDSIAWQD